MISSFRYVVRGCIRIMSLIPFGLLIFIDYGVIEIECIIRMNWITGGRICECSLVDIVRCNHDVRVLDYEAIALAYIQLYERLLSL